jgi:hypothetical protein
LLPPIPRQGRLSGSRQARTILLPVGQALAVCCLADLVLAIPGTKLRPSLAVHALSSSSYKWIGLSEFQSFCEIPRIAEATYFAACLRHYGRNPNEVERLASDLMELSTRHNFALWLARGTVLRGWARSASGKTAQGISWIENGIEVWRINGAMLGMPYYLALKSEALYLAGRREGA